MTREARDVHLVEDGLGETPTQRRVALPIVSGGVDHYALHGDRIALPVLACPPAGVRLRRLCQDNQIARRSDRGYADAMAEISYRRHRFPPVIIQHAVWLYLRFTLSYRDVEELLAERGLDISYETVRCWVRKFGPVIVRRLRRCRSRPTDRWFGAPASVCHCGGPAAPT